MLECPGEIVADETLSWAAKLDAIDEHWIRFEFDLAGLDEGVVLEFLLHGHIGPRFHYTDLDTAIANVQQLFRRASGATP